MTGQAFLSSAFKGKSGTSGKKIDGEDNAPSRNQLELAKALAIMGVKPSAFHQLHLGGKRDKVKKMLEKALMKRTTDHRERELMDSDYDDEYDPNKNPDLQTIHEAYQYLIKSYVDDANRRKDASFLSLEQIRANHEKRKGSAKSDVGDEASRPASRAGSRRGSFRADTGPKDMKVLDQIKRKEKEERKLQRYYFFALLLFVDQIGNDFRRKSVRAKMEKEEEERASDPRTQLELNADSLADALLFINNAAHAPSRRKSLIPDLDEVGNSITSGALPSSSRRGSQRFDVEGDAAAAASGEDDETSRMELPDNKIKRRGSRYKSQRKKKDKNKPYRKKKGRNFQQEEGDDAEGGEEPMQL